MEPHVSHYLQARFDIFDSVLPAVLQRRGTGPLARLRASQEKRRALHQLARLDDRLLGDIGLSQAEIRPVVDGLVSTGVANDNRRSAAAA